jgi:hypothetical protein
MNHNHCPKDLAEYIAKKIDFCKWVLRESGFRDYWLCIVIPGRDGNAGGFRQLAVPAVVVIALGLLLFQNVPITKTGKT